MTKPFAAFAADSGNWCFGPVLELKLLYDADVAREAWGALWSDEAVRGPFTDLALSAKAPSQPPPWREELSEEDRRTGVISFPSGEAGFRAGMWPRGGRPGADPAGDEWLQAWLPPRMASRIAPDWETAHEAPRDPANLALWEGLVGLVRRIKSRAPFRIAFLGDECCIPTSDGTRRWEAIMPFGSIIVDTGCGVSGDDIALFS